MHGFGCKITFAGERGSERIDARWFGGWSRRRAEPVDAFEIPGAPVERDAVYTGWYEHAAALGATAWVAPPQAPATLARSAARAEPADAFGIAPHSD